MIYKPQYIAKKYASLQLSCELWNVFINIGSHYNLIAFWYFA